MGTKYLTLQEDPAKTNPRSPLMEAAFRPKDLKQASMLLAKMAGKWAGTKFHRIKLKPYGYHTFKKSNGSGQGYMFIAPTGEKIRFGYLNKASGSGVLNQVDYWAADNGTWDSPDQSYQISSWINSVQVARDLFAYMFTGRMVNEQLNEADILQTKAGQYALHIGMPEQDVAGYGTTSGLMNKLKKHPNFDKEEYRGFEKVESQEENGAAKATKRAEKQLDERPLSDPEFIFDDIEKLTRVVATGAQNSLIIAGDPGVGKTFHVEKTLNEMLGQPGGRTGKWVQYKGARVTALGLYKIMFEHRDEMMIVFDDSDSVWKDADAVNMLKSALDTSDQRQIRWGSNATRSVDKMDKDEREEIYREVDNALEEEPENVGGKIKMPNMFEFSSQVIFITNLTPDKIDSAIRSRSLFMDVHLAREDMIKRIKTVLKHKYQSIPMEEKDQVVDQLQEGQGDVTMRSVEAALAIKSSGIEDWERLVGQYV